MKTSRMYVSTLSNKNIVTRLRVTGGQITTRTRDAALRRLGAAMGEGLALHPEVGDSDPRLVCIDVVDGSGRVMQVIL